jgi:hypothetical protein
MSLQFGLTPELTNTQFAPVAALSAHYEAQNVLQPLQSVTSEARQSDFTLANKLTQVILSILTGCEFISVVNTRLCPEQKLTQLYRIDRFADQSTLSRALNGLTQMNLVELNTAVQQTCHRCSRTLRHDWRGFLLLDFDLSGLPCGKQAQGGTKGYFSGKKTSPDGSWHVSVQLITKRLCGPICFPAIGLLWNACNQPFWASKVHLSYLSSSENARSTAWTEVLALMKTCVGSWSGAINC